MQALKDFLFKPLNPYRLALFRIVFGFFATVESLYLYRVHFVEDYVVGPQILFNYDFLPVSPLSEGLMKALLFICLVASILILLGKFYKWAITAFFLIFSYFFLLDKAIYNNHLYLIALLAFLLIFIPADEVLSLKKKKSNTASKASNWHLLILQFQFFVVYFYGGIAKMNADWLVHHEPAKSMLTTLDVSSEAILYIVVYGGIVFDLLIGFLLLYRPTRILAAIGVLLFNTSNHFLFDDINIFPFFMMASLVVFVDITEWKRFAKWRVNLKGPNKQLQKAFVLPALLVYVLLQVLLPFRHLLTSSNPEWSGEGQRFSWRMKIQTREVVELEYAIFDVDKKTIYPVDLNRHIHSYQVGQMGYDPKMMLDFAHYLGEAARTKSGLKRVMVKAKVKVGLNGRDAQYVFSPDIDLLKQDYKHFTRNQWIADLNKY